MEYDLVHLSLSIEATRLESDSLCASNLHHVEHDGLHGEFPTPRLSRAANMDGNISPAFWNNATCDSAMFKALYIHIVQYSDYSILAYRDLRRHLADSHHTTIPTGTEP